MEKDRIYAAIKRLIFKYNYYLAEKDYELMIKELATILQI
jgi:hypothetical protein